MTVWENDIAILKISDPGDPICVQEETFGFITKHIRPACLPKKVSYCVLYLVSYFMQSVFFRMQIMLARKAWLLDGEGHMKNTYLFLPT